MRIVATSDWHGEFPRDLPDGDVLVVAGDLLPVWDHNRQFQSRWIMSDLLPHLYSLPYDRVICIAGNHDFVFQDTRKFDKLFHDKVVYLRDEEYEFDGVKFWGSPYSVSFGDWAFMKRDKDLAEKWATIPNDTDVLIIHGPPYGLCDKAKWGDVHVGSRTLTERIIQLNAQLLITGHIHEAYGIDNVGKTVVANVSFRDVDYQPVNKAMVFDV